MGKIYWLLAFFCVSTLSAQAQTVRYVHTDALGSVVAVTDENRNIVERREYEPYGAQLIPAASDGPGYTGHVQDAATGLVYMQQRYYDPLGRFVSVDPVVANPNTGENFNRYAYANNNPYKFTDPDGRNAVTALGGVIYETGQFLQGNGFDGEMVMGALADGYNGEGDGFASAAFQDVTSFVPAGAIGGAAIKVAQLARAEKLAGRIATMGKEGSKGVRDVVGTAKDAKKTFDILRGGNKVKEVKPGVFTAKGANGGTVTYRATSKSGPPTVDVNGGIDSVRKIKFKEP